MAKINVKDHREAYRTQEERGTFKIPPAGTYDVVNISMQRAKVGKNDSPKIHIRTAILAVVDVDEGTEDAKKDANEWVGRSKDQKTGAVKFTRTFGQDLWMTTDNRGEIKKANAERLSCMGIAHGITDSFDPDDDKSLVHAVTGVPYRIQLRHRTETYNNNERVNLDVLSTKLLGEAGRKKYSEDPDFKAILGEAKDRVLAEKVKDYNGGGGRRSSRPSDQPQEDPFENIPFSECEPS